ncbi:hypothetical protein JMJ77_0003341 [Colletotrichum scovillei]|uniref:Uncharacterized protein n=1 Tax=Colletotrichum scovillei TaxID=1209932 RepID=A0A9P7QU98_9PEZI|nr:hypothetical protein JMJ78_0006562 [Colletotrichum scovillei]KAG7043639.1 hypothetical protein JMJ77_0003341 [Colletotrichum scovillei]KAG7063088.1 hypothetical protein JMJ76_0009926 [Colletotrichum scovillei]
MGVGDKQAAPWHANASAAASLAPWYPHTTFPQTTLSESGTGGDNGLVWLRWAPKRTQRGTQFVSAAAWVDPILGLLLDIGTSARAETLLTRVDGLPAG